VNTKPTLEDPGKQQDREGDDVALQLVGADVDGDTLHYSAFGLPPGLELNADTGLISGTLAKKGDYLVLARVSDGELSAFRVFTWEVGRRNKPPVIKKPKDQVSEAGKKASLDIDAHDPDRHDRLEFSATDLPPGLSINSTTGLISGTPTTPGTYQVVVTVTDGSASDSAMFTWKVEPANHAPVVQSPGHQQNRRNQTIDLQLVATDPDGDPLTYRAHDLPEGLSINATTGRITGTIRCTEPGVHRVEITVSDGKTGKTIKFNWTILPNGRPTAANPGTQFNKVNDTVSLQIVAVDPDGDDVEFSAIGLPDGLRIDASTGRISGTISNEASIVGTHKVEMLASDGSLRHAIFFIWKISE
jgi:hypothetical protein